MASLAPGGTKQAVAVDERGFGVAPSRTSFLPPKSLAKFFDQSFFGRIWHRSRRGHRRGRWRRRCRRRRLGRRWSVLILPKGVAHFSSPDFFVEGDEVLGVVAAGRWCRWCYPIRRRWRSRGRSLRTARGAVVRTRPNRGRGFFSLDWAVVVGAAPGGPVGGEGGGGEGESGEECRSFFSLCGKVVGGQQGWCPQSSSWRDFS